MVNDQRVSDDSDAKLRLILGRRKGTRRVVGYSAKRTEPARELITYAGDGHLMTIAATGTGKTSGPVICNALTHNGQLIVVDIKGEIHAATAAKRREMGREVHVLDLRDNGLPGSLNPLDLLAYVGEDVAATAQGLAGELIERQPGEKDRFWSDWSETLIAGGLTWAIADCTAEDRRLSKVFDLFNSDDSINYRIASLLDVGFKHPAARAAFGNYMQITDITQSGLLSTVQSHLRLLGSDLARRLTDTSSLDVKALLDGAPMSLYIIVPPTRLTAFCPLLRVFITSLILSMTARKSAPPYKTLLLCDEAGNIGKMDAFFTAATLLRSWGLTLWTFWQSASQLALYKEQANTLVDNAGVVQFFGARNFRAAQEMANIVGGISPEEILGMQTEDQILLMEGKLIRCEQIRYYSDELFKSAR